MSKTPAFNPYLPSWEYIPDGEPYVFGDRVYVYGSHDFFNGYVFCLRKSLMYPLKLVPVHSFIIRAKRALFKCTSCAKSSLDNSEERYNWS